MATIRCAVPGDTEAITAIWLQAWRVGYRGIVPDAAIDRRSDADAIDYWRTALADPEQRRFVVVAEDASAGVVGFAQAGPPDDDLVGLGYDQEVWKLYILPAYQAQGIGRQLMSAMAGQLAAAGMRSVLLRAFTGNAVGGFYERLGAQVLGTEPYEILGVRVPTAVFGWPDLAVLRAACSDAAP